jgi:5-methylcytosine-specific restriction enzyme B
MTSPAVQPPIADPIAQAAARYDRAKAKQRLAEADAQRAEIVKRFPPEAWPTLPVERYALGQEASEDTYCRWLEFRSPGLGSIGGNTSAKMVIYKRRQGEEWYYPKEFGLLDEAWKALRGNFVDALRLANAGSWDAIDTLTPLDHGPMVCLKTLHVYHPDDVLPIYSSNMLRHFLRLFGHTDEDTATLERVALNRRLLEAVRAHPTLHGWSTNEIGFFLFDEFDPREVRRVVKVAPGEDAKYWEDCLENGYICVGWDDVGDLDDFRNKTEFRERFAEAYGRLYPRASKLSAKANEVWTLRELSPGDLVVANQGISNVLAVGEVEDPGYEWRSDRREYKHTVRVKWDVSAARSIPPQRSWGTVTVAKVPPELYDAILSAPADGPQDENEKGRKQTSSVPLDPELRVLAETLDRKGQLILYGPPGTGKTYTARRLAVAFLLRHAEKDAAATLADAGRFAAAERELALSESAPVRQERLSRDASQVAPLTLLTFHPSYGYEDFIEGFRPYDAGTGTLALRLEDGVFKRVCAAARANPEQRYVVLIDEINRANLGKVFGEIITLLERDKRDLLVTLPQSKESFAVPPNVHIIGTMNTADRSIKLLDAALRRRFAFAELLPDVSLLQGAKVGSLALDEFLEEINRRIAREAGREKQIGHSFLLDGKDPVSEPEEFARRFRQEILPLLQEYCYDDYAALATYLGSKLVDRDAGTIDTQIVSDASSLIAALEEELARNDTST